MSPFGSTKGLVAAVAAIICLCPLANGFGFQTNPLGFRPARSAATQAGKWYCGMYDSEDVIGTTKRGKEKNFFVPATSLLSWRQYRARLIKSETPYWMRRASQETGVWAHEIPQLESGCVLIESPQFAKKGSPLQSEADFQTSRLDRRVIFLIEHSAEHGSHGLILNKPTPCEIGDLTQKLDEFGTNVLHFGGEGRKLLQGKRANRELHTLHTVSGLKGAEEVMDGIHYGADLRQAKRLVNLKLANPTNFKFFYSNTRWEAGELEKEHEQGRWIAASGCRDLIMKPSSYWDKPLWRLILEVLGGRHSLMCRETCDDF